jgi:hypothetical protein
MNLAMSLNKDIPAYFKGSDILVSIRLGTEAAPTLPSTLVDYSFELVQVTDGNLSVLVVFKKTPEGEDKQAILVDDATGRINLVVPKELTKEAVNGTYYVIPTLVLNTTGDANYGIDQFTDKAQIMIPAFNLFGYD